MVTYTDQQRYDMLGINGNPLIKTPNQDKLGREGVTLHNAHVECPICVPSRVSLFTGRYSHATQSYHNVIGMLPRERDFVSLLRENGYTTALIGKDHCFQRGRDRQIFDYLSKASHTCFLPPVARFEIPDTIVAGEATMLKGTAGDQVTYAWDLGPAGKSAERNPAVTFPEAVMTDLSLTVTNAQGQADTLTRNRFLVGVRFGGEIWRPWVMRQKTGGGRGRLATDGALVVSGAMPIGGQGVYSLLRSAPRLRKDYVIEATVAEVKGNGKDPRIVGGLTLVSNLRTGLGFTEFDYEGLTTHASLLLGPDGALRRLQGKGVELEELLPPGSVKFPAKLRLSVKAGKAVAAVEIQGVWKDVATFTLPDDIGLMPALAAGSPGNQETTMLVTAAEITGQGGKTKREK